MDDATIHPVDERLPAPRLFALGLQHVLVMYAGAIAVPLIIGGALKLPKEQIAMLINADLFCSIGAGMIPLVAPTFFAQMPNVLSPILYSGILLAAFVAVLLNAFFNGSRGDAVIQANTIAAAKGIGD